MRRIALIVATVGVIVTGLGSISAQAHEGWWGYRHEWREHQWREHHHWRAHAFDRHFLRSHDLGMLHH